MASPVRRLQNRTVRTARVELGCCERPWRRTASRFGHWFTIGSLVVLAVGCQKKSACLKNGVVVDIAGNHGHEASISAEPIQRGIGGVYPLRGGTHEHAMMLTDADMKALQDGKPVTTRSTSVDGHVHEIRVTCKE